MGIRAEISAFYHNILFQNNAFGKTIVVITIFHVICFILFRRFAIVCEIICTAQCIVGIIFAYYLTYRLQRIILTQ